MLASAVVTNTVDLGNLVLDGKRLVVLVFFDDAIRLVVVVLGNGVFVVFLVDV